MQWLIPAIIVVIIVLAIVFFKIFTSILRAASLLIFTVLFVGVIFGFFIYQDFQVLKESFTENETVYLLDDNGTFIAGFYLDQLNFSTYKPISDYEEEFARNMSGLRVVVQKSVLPMNQSSDLISGTVSQALESPDSTRRATAFMIGMTSLAGKDSVWSMIDLLRDERIAVFPQSFMIQTLTFKSDTYATALKTEYSQQKEGLLDSLGVNST